MIVFGAVRSSEQTWARFADAGIRRVAEESTVVIVKEHARSIADAYSEILDTVCREHPSAEAVVLLHQDLEIRDDAFLEKIRPGSGTRRSV